MDEIRRRYGGIPQVVLDNPELLQLTLPCLRADFTVFETYEYAVQPPLDCPISAFGGTDDRYVRREALEPWAAQTTRAFSLRMLTGDHFFLQDHRASLLTAIAAALAPPVAYRRWRPMSDGLRWETELGGADLAAGEIHVWLARLGGADDESAAFDHVLAPDEQARAGRFKFERDRRQFAAARTILRRLLGRYLKVDPLDVAFVYSRYGKPAVSDGPAGFSFNLSHSGNAAVVAVSRAGEVGVDIEAIRPMHDQDDLAERFFSGGEVRSLRAVPLESRNEAFFTCWTRKEAFIKAVGEGLSHALDSFEVTLAPSDPVRLIHVAGDTGEASTWTLAALPAEPGYAGALAVRGAPSVIRYGVWPAARRRPASMSSHD